MCGCSSCATVRASRTNRTASDGEGVRPRSMTLTATSRFNGCSRTRNTAANPPSPSRSPTVNSFPRACCRRRRSVTVSSDMTDAKPRNARRLALGIVGAALVWLFGVWPPPVWWRDHWPRETAMMRERWTDGRLERSNLPTFQPTALKDISPVLQRMVIIGEDSRFRTHHGIDPAEIGDALGLGPRSEHDHAAARQEPVPLVLAQPAPQGQRGDHGVAARARALEGSHPGAVSEHGAVGARPVGRGRGEPRLLWRAAVAPRRGAGRRPRRDPAPPAHVHPDVPARPHAGAARPHPRSLPRRRRVHPAGGGGHGTARAAGDCAAHRVAERSAAGAGRHSTGHDDRSQGQQLDETSRRTDGWRREARRGWDRALLTLLTGHRYPSTPSSPLALRA